MDPVDKLRSRISPQIRSPCSIELVATSDVGDGGDEAGELFGGLLWISHGNGKPFDSSV
jgi:hypothetical protein